MKNNRITTASDLVRVATFTLLRQPHHAVALPGPHMRQGGDKRRGLLRGWSRSAGGRELWEDWIFATLMLTSLIAIVVAGAVVVR